MGDPSTSTDKPTTLMRLVLAVVTAATTLFTAGPVILILGALLACGLFAGAALSLAHTGALDPGTFASAHRDGLAGLVAFFVLAVGHRAIRRDARGLLGAVGRRPVITAALALPVLSLMVVGAGWNRGGLPELSGAFVIDGLYFFSVGAVMLMAASAALVARGLYRWAAAGRYRAGLVTGAQATVLASLILVADFTTRLLAPSPAPTPSAENPALIGWQSDVTAAAQATSAIEAERRLLIGVAALLEPGLRQRPAPAVAAPAPTDDDEIRACIEALVGDIAQVRRSVGARFRLSDDDAHDIVQDALLNVCNAHARKRYTRLGAVLQTAAERRALSWIRRRPHQCEIGTGWPVCAPDADDLVRFRQEDGILDGVICEEDDLTQRIIWLRVQDELSFAQVGIHFGLTADEARFKFNNALRRMRKRLAALCDP